MNAIADANIIAKAVKARVMKENTFPDTDVLTDEAKTNYLQTLHQHQISIENVLRNMPSDFEFIDNTGGKYPINSQLLMGWSDYFKNVVRDGTKTYEIDVSPHIMQDFIDYLVGAQLYSPKVMFRYPYDHVSQPNEWFTMYDNAKLMMMDEYATRVNDILCELFDGSMEMFFKAKERKMKTTISQWSTPISRNLAQDTCGSESFRQNLKHSIENLTPEESKILLKYLSRNIYVA